MKSLRSMRTTAAVTGALLGLLVMTAVADDPFNWQDYFPIDRTMRMSATTWKGNGPKTVVQADRGPLVSGTFQIQARVWTEPSAVPLLAQIKFKVAIDSNSNGVIDAGEWTVMSTVAASVLPDGRSFAQTSTLTAGSFMDVYRIEHTYSNGFVSYDDVFNSDKTVP